MALAVLICPVIAIILSSFGQLQIEGAHCPPRRDLTPCTCDGSYIICAHTPNFDLRGTFEKSTTNFTSNSVYGLTIFNTELQNIPSNFAKGWKFWQIKIHKNRLLKQIHPNAFAGSYNDTFLIEVSHNPLLAQNVFDFLRPFASLTRIVLSNLTLKEIPIGVFHQPMPQLFVLDLSWNIIQNLEPNIFTGLTNLKYLDLSNNNLINDGIAPDTFAGMRDKLVVYMQENKNLTYLKREIFEPILNAVEVLYVGGKKLCAGAPCDIPFMKCALSSWLCESTLHGLSYSSKVMGFTCSDNQTSICPTRRVACSPEENFDPCTCEINPTTAHISCDDITDNKWDMDETFKLASQAYTPSWPETYFTLSLSPVQFLGANVAYGFKFCGIHLKWNANLQSIHPAAFENSRETLQTLEISDSPYLNSSILKLATKFVYLETFRASYLSIETIPTQAFANASQKLEKIDLHSNCINSIGSKAFARLDALKYLSLGWNELSNKDIHIDAFAGLNPGVLLDLQQNKRLVYLNETIFKPVLDIVKQLIVGDEMGCDKDGCSHFQRLGTFHVVF